MVAVGAWGLFEWRVRGENKTLIRLSALGTAGLVLTLAAVVVATALVIPFMLGLPALTRMSEPFAMEQIVMIDLTVGANRCRDNAKGVEAVPENAERASLALNRLSAAAGAIPTGVPAAEPLTVDGLRMQLRAANDQMVVARQAAQEKDGARLEAALRKFHELYDPIGKAAKRR